MGATEGPDQRSRVTAVNGVPEETCQNYEKKKNECDDFHFCQDSTR